MTAVLQNIRLGIIFNNGAITKRIPKFVFTFILHYHTLLKENEDIYLNQTFLF